MADSYKQLLSTQSAAKSPREVLSEPVTALLGVSPEAAGALAQINIESVFDLAASATFRAAALAAGVDGAGNNGAAPAKIEHLPLDLVDKDQAKRPLQELAAQPVAVLRAIGDTAGDALKAALSLSTVRDLGLWPPYHAARVILSAAYGGSAAEASQADQAPGDLIPATGRYPTERVRYPVLLYIAPLNSGMQTSAPSDNRLSLEQAGPIDVTAGVGEGFARPAVGAVLTYTQSWYTEGLALGQLLHSVALAPGESTRIAMIDWSRRTGARITEAITETEQLNATLTHRRALTEVVDAVAEETQTGRSGSAGPASAPRLGPAEAPPSTSPRSPGSRWTSPRASPAPSAAAWPSPRAGRPAMESVTSTRP